MIRAAAHIYIYIYIYRVLTWIRNPFYNCVPKPSPLYARFTWIRNRPQMLVCKHEMHFLSHCVLITCDLGSFRGQHFIGKKTTQGTKIGANACLSNQSESNHQNILTIDISKKTLNIFKKRI